MSAESTQTDKKERSGASDQAEERNTQAEVTNEVAEDEHQPADGLEGPENDQADSVEKGELQKQLVAAERKADEHYQRYLRSQADFDNFKRRTRLEKEEQAKYASQSLLEQLLPALDNFERALNVAKDSKDIEGLLQGLDMVFRQVGQALTAEGLVEIEAEGQPFDPNVHQAVMQVESEDAEPGMVIEVLQKGYKLKDKVIRPAMVKVSQ